MRNKYIKAIVNRNGDWEYFVFKESCLGHSFEPLQMTYFGSFAIFSRPYAQLCDFPVTCTIKKIPFKGEIMVLGQREHFLEDVPFSLEEWKEMIA